MITFHDWIVSGGNRLSLLADALTAAREHGAEIATIAESPDWLAETRVTPRLRDGARRPASAPSQAQPPADPAGEVGQQQRAVEADRGGHRAPARRGVSKRLLTCWAAIAPAAAPAARARTG